ncbi:DNA cytosine methyltransferase [Listeria booriae]|uniref:DNA cytosine methyltransferase n=1 Tax=Listeria booriae TaxID=1552123 RepID=UPI00162432FD|nr:DNA cytosine methyltransferase [Listeria booriae]
MINKPVKFIDLFAGIGGFRMALERIGFQCVYSSEIDKDCKQTYFENYGDFPDGDITLVNESSIPDHDILCAGFPCQPFSISGKQKGFEDVRGTLFFDICRIVEAKSPQVIFLENVKHLVHHDGGHTFKTIINKLEELGYILSYKVLNASYFGVPQNRERIIIIGTKKNRFDFDKINKSIPRPVINDILDTTGDFEFLSPEEYTLLKEMKTQKISGLIFAGHRNKKIRKAGVRPGTEHLSRVHKQPNRIYSAKGIHPTIPSQETSGRFFVLLDNMSVRKLTINECYKLMGYPPHFKRTSSLGKQYKQIGNSVCVPMIEEIARQIKKQIFDEKEV